ATEYADGRVESVEYDGAGKRCGVSRNGAEVLKIRADDAGRPLAVTYADGRVDSFAYDDAGRLVSAECPDGVSRFAYDAQGRLVEEDNDGSVFRFAYDATGLLTSIEYPDGSRAAFAYDEDRRVVRATDWSGGVTTFERDRADATVTVRTANRLETATAFAPS